MSDSGRNLSQMLQHVVLFNRNFPLRFSTRERKAVVRRRFTRCKFTSLQYHDSCRLTWFLEDITRSSWVRGNRGLLNGPVSSYVISFTEELQTRPYMVTKRRFVWNKTFLLISIITSNDCPPAVFTDINSQFYFVHWHLRQYFIQSTSWANRDVIFVDSW